MFDFRLLAELRIKHPKLMKLFLILLITITSFFIDVPDNMLQLIKYTLKSF